MHARSRRVVFVIDSDDDARVTHETILRTEGYELLSANDGARALPLLRELSPNLVLLGSKIGHMSVSRLIQMMRADPALRDVSIVVAGPAGDAALKDDALRAGAHQYVPLPTPPQELVRVVVALIGRA